MFNLGKKVFACGTNKKNSYFTRGTLFYFSQDDNTVSATVVGKDILFGYLLGKVNKQGLIEGDIQYYNFNIEFFSNKCLLRLELTPCGSELIHGVLFLSQEEPLIGISLVEQKCNLSLAF